MKKWTAFTFLLFLILSTRGALASTDLVKRWEFQLSGVLSTELQRSSPVVDADGNAYAASRTQVVSIDYYGNKRWEANSGAIYPQLQIAGNKLIFANGDLGGKVTALNKDTGAKLWETVLDSVDFIYITSAPKVFNAKVYVTYEINGIGKTYVDVMNLADGLGQKETVLANKVHTFGLLRSDLVVPNLASSEARLYGVDGDNILFSVSRSDLSVNSEDVTLVSPTKALAISSDDSNVAVAAGNNLAFIKVISEGRLSKGTLTTVNLKTPINSLGLFSGDKFFVNTLSSSETPAAIVAISKTQNKELWRRDLPLGVKTLPAITDQNLIAEVSDNLYFYNKDNGSLIQTIPLGNINSNNFSGPATSGAFTYIVTKDGKLTAFGPPAPHHPVILIHGLGGNPADWEDGGNKDGLKKRLLEKYRSDQPDYPDSWIVPYSYTGFDKTTGGYNSEGRVEDITLGMPDAIASLSAELKAKGGDGMVDIVGYSMGGLVLREYLATHPDFPNVRKCIAVGSPNEGSFFADIERGFVTLAKNVQLNSYAQDTVNQILESNHYKINFESEGIKYLYTDSSYSAQLKNREMIKNPIYDSIASDFSLRFQMRIMYMVVTATPVDVGDLVISKQSATTISPISPTNTWVFNQSLDVPLAFTQIGPMPGLTVAVPRIANLEFFHPYMMRSEQIQQQIIDELYGISEDDIRRV